MNLHVFLGAMLAALPILQIQSSSHFSSFLTSATAMLSHLQCQCNISCELTVYWEENGEARVMRFVNLFPEAAYF